jgi:hypothetical protein
MSLLPTMRLPAHPAGRPHVGIYDGIVDLEV